MHEEEGRPSPGTWRVPPCCRPSPSVSDCATLSLPPQVYEKEGALFFTDWTEVSSSERMKAWDRRFSYFKALPNVIITPHAAFLTNVSSSAPGGAWAAAHGLWHTLVM